MTTPEEQRMASLDKANVIRTKRARLKRDLRKGRDPFRVLMNPPDYAATMTVETFLRSLPRVGRIKANRLAMVCRISSAMPLGKLTDRQKKHLATQVKEKGWVGWTPPESP